MGFLEFLANPSHFIHVLPLLLVGGFALAIIIERYQVLYKKYQFINKEQFFDEITQLVASGKTNEAVSLCEKFSEKPLTQVVKSGLLRAHLPENLIHHGIELAISDANEQVQKRTSFLATIANVATLLGLFGTIAGLIHSFQAVGQADPQQKSALLAEGIATAMNATMMGLGIAIPCMIAFSFLMNRTNKIVQEIETSGIKTVDILKQHYFHSSFDEEAKLKRVA